MAIESYDLVEQAGVNNVSATAHARAAAARVLLIEDHPIFCEGLRALLADDESLVIADQVMIGHASDVAPMLDHARQCQPDLILLDIRLGEVSGLDLVSPLRRICPNSKIAVLTAHSDREYVLTALRLGIHAFLAKDMAGSALKSAMHDVLAGQRVIGQPQMMTVVLQEFGQFMQTRERDCAGLASQQVEILRLAATGLNNREIGNQLFWSEITVKRKMQDIYRRLCVKGRAQAVAEAMRLGLI